MTMRFILAIAANGKIRMMRQRGQKLDSVAVLWCGHFSAVLFYKLPPLGRRRRLLRDFHCPEARSQVRKPHIIPVLRCELRLRHTPWRTSNGSDAQTLILCSLSAQSDHAY